MPKSIVKFVYSEGKILKRLFEVDSYILPFVEIFFSLSPKKTSDPKKMFRETSLDEPPSTSSSQQYGAETCSLPGTPMDSEQNYDLNSSANSSILYNSSKGSLVIATHRAQVTTPSHVNLGSHIPNEEEKL